MSAPPLARDRAAARPRPAPPFTAEHEALRAEIRSFVAEELRPHAAEWEEACWFPDSVFERMAELGLLGLKYPKEYGGRGGGYVEDAVLTQELSRCGSGGLAAGFEILGAPVGTVKGRMRLGLDKLRNSLRMLEMPST